VNCLFLQYVSNACHFFTGILCVDGVGSDVEVEVSGRGLRYLVGLQGECCIFRMVL
jgi:hypothetical protein